MSRLDDLLDLIQTTNDIYLMNPARNIRSAFIQIDDLCELLMKSYLQANVGGWSPLRNPSDPYSFKGFRTITREVAGEFSGNQQVRELLTRIEERRDNRNHFFHDQNQAGLTVDEQNCLLAFSDLYHLASLLYGGDFSQRLEANPVVKAQMAVIHLRLRGSRTRVVYEIYQQVLRDMGKMTLEVNSLGHEYRTLYEDATQFLRWTRQQFEGLITDRNNEIDRIRALPRRNKNHYKKLNRLTAEVALYGDVIRDCLS